MTLSARRRLTQGVLYGAFVLVVVLFVLPLCIVVFMSLSDWPLLGSPTLIGVGNYVEIFTDPGYVGAIVFTLGYTALATVSAFIYNVAADFAGGVEITLSERD